LLNNLWTNRNGYIRNQETPRRAEAEVAAQGQARD
jgi:hypothetical protein